MNYELQPLKHFKSNFLCEREREREKFVHKSFLLGYGRNMINIIPEKYE